MKNIKTVTFQDNTYNVNYQKNKLENSFCENHCHEMFEFIIVVAGDISCAINEKSYEIKDEALIAIAPFAYHSLNAKSDYERITFLFDKNIIPPEIKPDFLQTINRSPVICNDSIISVIHLLRNYFVCSNGNEYPQLLFTLLKTLFYYSLLTDNRYNVSNSNSTIRALVEYIDNHISDKLCLDDLSQQLFLSKSTISHLFKDTLNISAKQYILQKKISYATALIRSGLPAQEAARQIGYDNYASFYKTYKRLNGNSPHSTRQDHQNKSSEENKYNEGNKN